MNLLFFGSTFDVQDFTYKKNKYAFLKELNRASNSFKLSTKN